MKWSTVAGDQIQRLPLHDALARVMTSDGYATGAEEMRFGAMRVWATWMVPPARAAIEVHIAFGEEVHAETLDVAIDTSGVAPRTLALCPRPHCENPRRLSVIFVSRQKGWGCRKCLRVKYPCHDESPAVRAAWGAEQVMRKLGAEQPEAFLSPPPKAPGMTWRRYWQLRAELTAYALSWWKHTEPVILLRINCTLAMFWEASDGPDVQNSRRCERVDEGQRGVVPGTEGGDRHADRAAS